MKRKYLGLRGSRRRERGAVSVLVAISMVVLLGFAALGVDYGYLAYSQRRLQSATDAAALAGAVDLWTQSMDTVSSDAQAFSAGRNNTLPAGVVPASAVVTGLKLASVTLPYAQAVSGNNGIQVTQQATVPLYFARVFGKTQQTISATSTAGAGGGAEPALYNVMIVLDATRSMATTTDNHCKDSKGNSQTRLQCAQAGALKLLTGLTNAGDNVGLMAFPPQTSSSYNFSCTGKSPTVASSYSASGLSYQISQLGTGYLGSNGKVSTTSSIVQALGGGNCSGMPAPGGLGTFYAQAITAAQAALQATSSTQHPAGQNVIILLSDGIASSTKTQLGSTYTSQYGSECYAAIQAAAAAKAVTSTGTSTLIYTVAYLGGEASSAPNCDDGSGGQDTTPKVRTACGTMQAIATSQSYFYSDTCSNAAGGTNSLNTLFTQIAYSLTKPRLIPQTAQ
ncbi:vWA domain-containing protein [Paraburkholderia sp. ZP32-5]|uniref:vWA domain-containing protein n=1 Tax=Paraburkholderia sp. ZP32-5 TaxID=2883245 RepID=UPI001F4202EF|nr:VWA domain-containing protein [Paraburkholderia sp. ZP32-5]